MHEYSRPLGDAIKRARGKLELTQNEVADAIIPVFQAMLSALRDKNTLPIK